MNNTTQSHKKSTAIPPQSNAFGYASRWLDAIDAGDKKAAFENLKQIARLTLSADKKVKP